MFAILGVSLGFNSSASLWIDGKCIASISEERLTGERNTKAIPLNAVSACVMLAGVQYDIDELLVAYSHYEELSNEYLVKYTKQDVYIQDNFTPNENLGYLIHRYTGINIIDIIRVDHHSAHAYSAYAIYGSPKKNSATITCDGFGDGISMRIIINDKLIKELPMSKSIALVYQFVTGALGFKEHQHEGKITGLATGKYIGEDPLIDRIYDALRGMLAGDGLLPLSDEDKKKVEQSHIIDFEDFLILQRSVYYYIKCLLPPGYDVTHILDCKEAIACAVAVQRLAEDFIMTSVDMYIPKNITSVYLAGGMFANVAINRLFGKRFKHVYISPAMGDEGTAMGAAAKVSELFGFKLRGFHPEYIIDGGMPIYGGVRDAKAVVYNMKYSPDEIVHICTGRNEFGPRALMHRSTLLSARAPRDSLKLNEAMKRSEFMPYAPVCREKDMKKFFINYKPFLKSLHFMTVALECKPGVMEAYPAAVHKDNTCRVQVVHKNVKCERFAYDLLTEYFKQTNARMCINTSFNMHNEPTCNTHAQCMSAWKRSGKIGCLMFMEDK